MDILYKNIEQDEISFINYVNKLNTSFWVKTNLNEHDLINKMISNPNLDHYNNLLFYHWYERRYKINVISEEILRNLNKVINVTKKELHDDVRERMLVYMNSINFIGYTIYYEYYHDFFPDIEKLNFNEFVGQDLITYLLNLFPMCVEIDYVSKKRFLRFQEKQLRKIEENGRLVLYYKANRLPSFYPRILDNINLHSHTPHKFLEKNRIEIENIIREEKSIPKIGEGWISETLLFYEIKEEFKDHNVIQHGSPKWLGQQHLDIFFPELNIAIEYQGAQHTKPVSFFGGQEAFIKNLERDSRKKKLCEENGVILLYVYPETHTLKFIEELKLIIEKLEKN